MLHSVFNWLLFLHCLIFNIFGMKKFFILNQYLVFITVNQLSKKFLKDKQCFLSYLKNIFSYLNL